MEGVKQVCGALKINLEDTAHLGVILWILQHVPNIGVLGHPLRNKFYDCMLAQNSPRQVIENGEEKDHLSA